MSFVFATCQFGAEDLLKAEIARIWGAKFRLAFSRPGYVTYKLAPGLELDGDFELGSVFAREYGLSLGKAIGGSAPECVAKTLELATRQFGGRRVALAVCDRDGVDTGPSANALEAESSLRKSATTDFKPWREIEPGGGVLDVVLVEPTQWWVGWHRHSENHRPWPGGVPLLKLPPEAPSRAYLKLLEGLKWQGFEVAANQTALELGSAPGGASYALLEKGLKVIGVDPADMDQRIMAHPKFRHLRMQAKQIAPKELGPIDWVVSDMNVSPIEALEAVAWVVQRLDPGALKGVLVTLKLTQLTDPRKVPELLAEVTALAGKLGLAQVKIGQLYFNRLELCLGGSATRKRSRS